MLNAGIRVGVIIFAGCMPMFASAQEDPSKRLTLSLSCQSVGALCSEISRQTGSTFTAEGPIAERKLTLVCFDKSLEEIKEQIAEFFGAEWVKRSNGIALRLLPETLSAERRQLQLEENSRRSSLNDALKLLVWCSQNSPDALEEFRNRPKSYGGAPLEIYEPDELAFLSRESELAQASLAIQAAREKHLTALLKGTVLGFSLEKRAGHIPLPALSTPPNEVESLPMVLSFDAATNKLRFATMFRLPSDTESLMPMTRDIALPTPKKLVEGPLAKREAAFMGVGLDGLKSVMAPNLPALPRSTYGARALGLTEHALFAANHFKVSVIADAFRVAVTGEAFPASMSLNTYCQTLVATSKARPFASVIGCKENKGWLQMRHAQPWRLYGSEVPEPLLVAMESRAVGGNAPSLDDYADLAGKLTSNERAFFEQRGNVLVRFPIKPLRNHIPLLAVWGSLNANQRAQAQSGGINISKMSRLQLNLLTAAATKATYSSLIKEDLYNRFSSGDLTFNGLSFFLKISPSTAQGFDTEILQLGLPGFSGPAIARGGQLVQFRIGADPDNGILTAFTIAGPNRSTP